MQKFMFKPRLWIEGTRNLNSVERGVYIELISRMYLMEGPIYDDDRELAGCCSLHLRIYRQVRQSLIDKGKLHVIEDGRAGPRLLANHVEGEIETAQKVRQRYTDLGRSGGRANSRSRPEDPKTAESEHQDKVCQVVADIQENQCVGSSVRFEGASTTENQPNLSPSQSQVDSDIVSDQELSSSVRLGGRDSDEMWQSRDEMCQNYETLTQLELKSGVDMNENKDIAQALSLSPIETPTKTESISDRAESQLDNVISANSKFANPDQIQIMMQRYNEVAERIGLPKVQKLTKARRSKALMRLGEIGGLDGWDIALQKMEASSFCRGDKTDWRASFDFMLQPSSLTKLMEGNYDDSQHKPDRSGQFASQGHRQDAGSIVAAVRENLARIDNRDRGRSWPDRDRDWLQGDDKD